MSGSIGIGSRRGQPTKGGETFSERFNRLLKGTPNVLCPFDSTTLQVVNRSGVEIDWCPSCKGVWLERGELDKLIDQADAAVMSSQPLPAPASAYSDRNDNGRRWDRDDDDDDDDDYRRRREVDGSSRPKKRKSMLSELFDF